MTPFDFIKLVFATWYLAYSITGTDGPRGIFLWMREKLPHGRHGIPMRYRHVEHGEVTVDSGDIYPKNGLLDCIICAAPWIALLVGIIGLAFERMWVIDVFAIAGGALLLHSFTGWRFGE